jgi:hypothetical protein
MKQNSELLMGSLARFYRAPGNIETVVEIAGGRSDVSLRVIDWFVTNYAKRKNIIHQRRPRAPPPGGDGAPRGPGGVSYFSVYLSYREELRTYSKQQFDPFRRNEHIVFRYGDGGELETTIGQLNFFRWAIENGIVEYIRAHRKEIEASMSSKEAPGPRARDAGGGRDKGGALDDAGDDAPPAAGRPPVVVARRSVISFD